MDQLRQLTVDDGINHQPPLTQGRIESFINLILGPDVADPVEPDPLAAELGQGCQQHLLGCLPGRVREQKNRWANRHATPS